jgi:hypothetical protein
MLPLVTAGLSLLQQKQKNDADKKKARMSALMGEAPSSQSGEGGGGKLGMLTSALGLMGNMGSKEPDLKSKLADRYKGDETTPHLPTGPMSDSTAESINLPSRSVPWETGTGDLATNPSSLLKQGMYTADDYEPYSAGDDEDLY